MVEPMLDSLKRMNIFNLFLPRVTPLSQDIVKAINVNVEKVDTACSLFSFGFGADHDETMLK